VEVVAPEDNLTAEQAAVIRIAGSYIVEALHFVILNEPIVTGCGQPGVAVVYPVIRERDVVPAISGPGGLDSGSRDIVYIITGNQNMVSGQPDAVFKPAALVMVMSNPSTVT